MKEKTERVCHFYKLSIRKDGNVYPCCLAYGRSLLGNLFDENIFETIENKKIDCECTLFKCREKLNGEKPNLKILHFEFSNECQARCVCCAQDKSKMENEEPHLEKLEEFIEYYMPENITVIGGEVLIQTRTLNWLLEIKKKYPEIKFDIVTNLCVGKETLKKAIQIFDYMTVSILGFQPLTYKKIMGLNFEKTLSNFDYILENSKVKLRPKYLAMPTNLYELPMFFEWALSKKAEKIYLHNIREFAKCCNLQDKYWQETFSEIERDLKKILLTQKERIISENKQFISIHKILADNTHIDSEFIEANGFTDIIKITS